MATTTYGDISPRTAAYAAKEFLERGQPYLCLEKFGDMHPLPSNSSKVWKARRYNSLDSTPVSVAEGVTPSAKRITYDDVTCTLQQLIDRVVITDVIMDTHEDPVLRETIGIMGEQAAEMIEKMRFNTLKAGTSVAYSGSSVTARTSVQEPFSIGMQRAIVAALKAQNARKITNVIRSTPSYGTVNVAPSFVALGHTNLQPDIEALAGFKPVEEYGTMSAYEGEIGKVGEVRYILSTIFEPWLGAGATVDVGGGDTDVLTTTVSGTIKADVYPLLFLGAKAWAGIALKGQFAVTPMVVNPKPSDSDPAAQRGHVAWKTMQGAVITNDLWMCRAEVACSSYGVTVHTS
jgi:N4-gp56 family major capsid protein